MSDYQGLARSNYFRVKDRGAFLDFCSEVGVTWWTRSGTKADEWLAVGEVDGQGWPTEIIVTDEDGTEDQVPIDFAGELASHLDPRDVAVLLEVGNQALKYLHGSALAIRSDGTTCAIDIHNIYALAKETLGHELAITRGDN